MKRLVKKSSRNKLNFIHYYTSFYLLYKYILVFFERNSFNTITKVLSSNYFAKMQQMSHLLTHLYFIKSNKQFKVFNPRVKSYGMVINEMHKYKSLLHKGLARSTVSNFMRSSKFFRKTFNYFFDDEKYKKYIKKWCYNIFYKTVKSRSYNLNNLILYVYQVYCILLYFNQLKHSLFKFIYNKKKRVKKVQLNQSLFYIQQLIQYKHIFLNYFNRLRAVYKIMFTALSKRNVNYFNYSFKLNWKRKINKNQDIDIFNFSLFNIANLFNNIIFKFFYFLNMRWINISYNNVNVILYNKFDKLKKNLILLHDLFFTYVENNRWKKVRKLIYTANFKSNNLLIYFSIINLNLNLE
jgi:hypothetical protein